MFAEAMAGVALVKASVEFIKSNIDTAKDIGEIAGAVDNLFKGQEDIEKKIFFLFLLLFSFFSFSATFLHQSSPFDKK